MIRRAAGFIGSWAQEIFGIGWLHFASPPPSGATDASISSLEGQGHQEQASGSGANRFACVDRRTEYQELGVRIELRHPGNHLSVLVENDDIKAIHAAHRDPVRMS